MQPKVAKILWFAILSSVVLLFIISDYIPPLEVSDRKIINWVFTMGSIVVGVLALRLGSTISLTTDLYPPSYLIQLLLIDSISVFGFILKILGASSTEAGIYFFISFIGLILVKPTKGTWGSGRPMFASSADADDRS